MLSNASLLMMHGVAMLVIQTVSLLYTFATGDCHMDPKGPIVNLGALRVHYGLEVIRQWAKR